MTDVLDNLVNTAPLKLLKNQRLLEYASSICAAVSIGISYSLISSNNYVSNFSNHELDFCTKLAMHSALWMSAARSGLALVRYGLEEKKK